MHLDATIPGAVGPEHWFAQTWASALGEVVEALDLGAAAGPLEVRAGEANPKKWEQWSEAAWHGQIWTPGANAPVWIGCPSEVPLALWKHIGGADAPDASTQALETFREMLNQSAASTAAEASARLGATVQASAVGESKPPESGWGVELHFTSGDQEHTIAIVGDAAMAALLNPPAVEQAAPAPPSQAATATKASAAAPVRAADSPPDPLDLIREVNMELAVSFGDTSLPLAHVLQLASGAIIELNRSVSDPVEVLVNGSVIARGDVVVVDGNYGVRITEIVSRRDRVRSML